MTQVGDKDEKTKKKLLNANYAPSTVKRYDGAVEKFKEWCEENKIKDTTDTELDRIVSDYVAFLYDEDCGRSLAEMTMSGIVMYIPEMKDQWKLTLKLVNGWRRMEPSEQHMMLSLHKTKSGRNKSVQVIDENVIKLVKWRMSLVKGSARNPPRATFGRAPR